MMRKYFSVSYYLFGNLLCSYFLLLIFLVSVSYCHLFETGFLASWLDIISTSCGIVVPPSSLELCHRIQQNY